MASDLASKWDRWWQPLSGGLTHKGLASGLILTGGWFWTRVRGGCLLYRRQGTHEAIGAGLVVGTAAQAAIEIWQYSGIEPRAGSYWYGAAAFGPGGLEGRAAPAVGLVLDADGAVAGGLPGDVERAWADAAGGGRIRVSWRYCPACEAEAPVEFRIYHDNGTGQIDYGEPAGIVAWGIRRNTYAWTSGPYAEGLRVRFEVRAASRAGEGPGTEATARTDATPAGWSGTMEFEAASSEVADAE